MLLSLCHCLWQSLFLFPANALRRAGSAGAEDPMLTSTVSSARPAARWPAWWYSTSLRSSLQKMLCGRTVDWDLWKRMITAKGSLPSPSEMAEARWLCMVVGYTNTPTSHFHFGLSHSKWYYRMHFFFHSRHLTWFKICRLLESHVASWEVCQFTASKIYLSPSQKQQRFRKHRSHLICKGVFFKDFISSSLSMNGLWAIFQLIYPFYSGLHTNNNRSKEHVFLLLQVLLCCAGNILSSRAVYFFALFSLLACPETSVWLGCLRTWVPP